MARGRGRRVRPLAAQAAPDDRGRHQRRARPPHDLRLVARRRRDVRARSSRSPQHAVVPPDLAARGLATFDADPSYLDGSSFDFDGDTVTLQVPGAHNRRNAAAALTAIELAGGTSRKPPSALGDLRGRRPALRGLGTTATARCVVDDYAHHPTEVRATIEAARTLDAAPRRRAASSRTCTRARSARPRAFGAGAGAGRPRRRPRRLSGARARRGLPGRHRPARRRGRPPTPAGGKRVAWMRTHATARDVPRKRAARRRPAADDGRGRRRTRSAGRSYRRDRRNGVEAPRQWSPDRHSPWPAPLRSASARRRARARGRRLDVAARLQPRRGRATSRSRASPPPTASRSAPRSRARRAGDDHAARARAGPARGDRDLRSVGDAARSTTDFPHKLTIQVIERQPVAALAAQGRAPRSRSPATGIVLRGVTAERDLPSLVAQAPRRPARGSPTGARCDALAVAGAAPEPLLRRSERARGRRHAASSSTLQNGPELVFGSDADARAKWVAAARVLAESLGRRARPIWTFGFPVGWPQEGSLRSLRPTPEPEPST